MIEVTDGVDAHGFYLVRGGGKTARSLDELARALNCSRDMLFFVPRPPKRHPARYLNTAERVAARTEFDPLS